MNCCTMSPFTPNDVFLLDPLVGCLNFTVQNDVCADFDIRRPFSHSSAGSGRLDFLLN